MALMKELFSKLHGRRPPPRSTHLANIRLGLANLSKSLDEWSMKVTRVDRNPDCYQVRIGPLQSDLGIPTISIAG